MAHISKRNYFIAFACLCVFGSLFGEIKDLAEPRPFYAILDVWPLILTACLYISLCAVFRHKFIYICMSSFFLVDIIKHIRTNYAFHSPEHFALGILSLCLLAISLIYAFKLRRTTFGSEILVVSSHNSLILVLIVILLSLGIFAAPVLLKPH